MYRKVKLQVPNLDHEFSIDTEGIVRNETNGKVLKGTTITKNNRYRKIHLLKFHALHRLVAEHFIPNPNGYVEVNHINGNRYDNRVCNLEWCSHSHNMKHAYSTGLKTNHGMKNPTRKLTESDVKQIWSLRDSTLTARQIRDKLQLSVGVGCIKGIRQGKNWSSVTCKL